ncbi:unnamed protein product [Rangifer tarandus platyrhynchus]|uniref:Uncharacterized protein n=2 Tax=Rangifer tarandus platyrhynchus TaxID=3082113 RepID=A0ACB0ECV3_RANTA|nr:unnamed protein product [Rangifer tarandus platyrhynchus]CAI9698292.1 unnamed protein product [Rangifer tarandus platyrhynchus]
MDSVYTGVRRLEPEERAEKSSSDSNEVSKLSNLGSGNGLMAEMQRKPRYPEEDKETAKGREQIVSVKSNSKHLVKSNIQKMHSHKWSGHMLVRLKGKQHQRSKASRREAHQATVLVREAASSKSSRASTPGQASGL